MTTPDWPAMARVFGRIGLLSFGGPAAQIALMHREVVESRPWLDEKTYLRALSLCMLLPGPEAMQLATYAGWRLRGVPGGLLAGLLFVLPGALVITILAFGYSLYGQLPFVRTAFLGVKATVVVLVFLALLKLSRKTLSGPLSLSLALLSFLGLFVFGLPFPGIILTAACLGYLLAPPARTSSPAPRHEKPATVRTLLIWGSLWLSPLALLWLAGETFLLSLGTFFAKLAVVSFGGAYAVLAYMTQTVVQDYGWITTEQMIDALGLAETTPGPLILVTQFVALLAGEAQSGLGGALAAGALALWVTFCPCFLWIFLAAPHLERIASHPRLTGALSAITAAVVGVIANLWAWFALHFLFALVRQHAWWSMPLPDWRSLDSQAVLLLGLAGLLMGPARQGFASTMGLTAAAALGLNLIQG